MSRREPVSQTRTCWFFITAPTPNVHARTACEGVWRGKTDANGDLRYPPPLNEARVSFVALKEGYVDAKVAGGQTNLAPREPAAPDRFRQLFLYTTLACREQDKPLIRDFLAPLAPEIETFVATGTPQAQVLQSSWQSLKRPPSPSCDPSAPVTCAGRQPPLPGG